MIKEGATVEVNYELFIDDENGEMVESTMEHGPMKFNFNERLWLVLEIESS